ncbi:MULTISPECIES: cation transporter [Exiguobacterium]|uniref:cation transporter n=1 Tax=Exiguobacterium TaxID=33986 RepID=UPI00258033BE|nr:MULTISPECIES: cation transporter [Exiguobacterium]
MQDEKTILTIKGMSCAHCVNKVESALEGLNGIESAKVNLKKGIAKVKYDETRLGVNEFKEVVGEVGYEVESAQ